MDLNELKSIYASKARKRTYKNRLKTPEYRKHYPLIKSAVQEGIPLRAAVRILMEKEDGAFGDRTLATVYQAYLRVLTIDGIRLREK